MRISTTPFLIICTVLFFSAFKSLAQPTFTVQDRHHTCGPGTPATGSFEIIVTAADASATELTISVIGGSFNYSESIPMGSLTLPLHRTIPGLTGTAGGRTYFVVISDNESNGPDAGDPSNEPAVIFNFTATAGTITQNTNPGCASPNGAIAVTLTGNSSKLPFVFSWTGPSGFTASTKDISGLSGGDYTLTYSDSNTPATQCVLGPIHIDDPTPSPYTISASTPSACVNSAFMVDVSVADAGYTYEVIEGATILASAPGPGAPLSINVPALPLGNHTLRVRATRGACPPRFNNAPDLAITVNPVPDYHDSTPFDVCSSLPLGIHLSDFKEPASVPATSFTLSVVSGSLTSVAGSATTDINDDVWKNATTAPIDVEYTVTPKTGTCDGIPFIVTVTITPEPVGAAATKAICSGDNVAFDLQVDDIDALGNSLPGTTFSWTAANNTNVTGEAVGPQTTGTINDPLVNTSSADQPVVYTVIPKSADGCVGTAFTVTVTVNVEPVAPNITRIFCSGDDVDVDLQVDAVNLGNAIAGTTFEWTVADNPDVTGESVGPMTTPTISDILTSFSTTSEDVVYNIIPTSPGGCEGSPFTLTVTVNPEPDAPDMGKVICSRDNVNIALQADVLDLGNALAGSTFTWTPDDNPDVTGESVGDQPGGTITDVLVNLSSTPQDVIYTIHPTSGLGCNGGFILVTVTVNPEPFAPSVPKTICSGDNVAVGLQVDAINLGNAIAGTTFSWTAADNINVTGEAVGAQTTPSISDALVNATSIDQIVTYTVTPKSPAGCTGAPFTVVITVNPRPSYKNYDNDLVAGGVCADPLNINLDTLKNATSVLATTYNITGIAFGALVPVGASTVVGPLPLNDVLANEISDDVWSNTTAASIDVIYTIVPKAGNCEGTAFTVKVTVKPQPDYSDGTAVACSGQPLLYDLDATKSPTGVAATSFNVTSIVPASADLTPLVNVATGIGNVNSIGDDRWQNVTNAPIDVEYTIVPMTAGDCLSAPFKIVVTINPEPVYSTAPQATICSEDIVGLDLEALKAPTSVSAVTFTFNTIPDTGLSPVGATVLSAIGVNSMAIADDQWRNVTNGPLNLDYVIIGKSADGCPSTAAFDVLLVISPQPDYNNYNNDLAAGGVCASPLGIDVTTLKKATSIAATSFAVTTPSPVDVTQIDGDLTPDDISDDVWSNVSNLPHDVVYSIVPSVGSCDGAPFTVTVTILPSPDYNSYDNDTAPGGTCSRDALAFDIASLQKVTSVAATVFTITNIASGTLTPAGGSPALGDVTPGQLADDQWSNVTSAPIDVVYTIIPKSGGCSGAPFTAKVTINPEPVAPINLTKTICTNDNVAIDLQTDAIDLGNALPGSTFEWTASDNINVTGETLSPLQTSSTINDALVNTTSVAQNVVYNIAAASAAGCEGIPFTITVTVSPKPVLAIGQAKRICSGTAVGYEILLNPTGMPTGTTFSWPDPDGAGPAQASAAIVPGGQIPMGVTGTIHINDILINPGSAPLPVNYVVTPSLNGACLGTPQTIAILVDQAAIVFAGADQTICTDNGPYTLVGAAINGAATDATWSFSSVPPGHDGVINPSATPLVNPATATFTATIPGDYILALTSNIPAAPSACVPVTDVVTITVTPKPVITPAQTTLVCANDPVDFEIKMTPAGLPAATVFNWPDPNSPGAAPGVNVPLGGPGTFHITDILRNDTNADINVNYDVTPSVGLCVGALQQIVVTVKPAPVLALVQTKTICSGDNVDYEILLNPVNTPTNTTFSWPDPDGGGPGTSRLDIPAGPAGTLHITDQLFNGTGADIPVNYSVIAKGANGCTGVVRTISIIVNPGAVVEAGNAQAICSNGTATLGGSSFSGLATEATWTVVLNPSGGDGVISPAGATTTPAASTFKASVAGDYTLQLMTDAPGGSCPAVSDIVVITVKTAGDPSCTGGSGTCSTVSIAPIPTPATCNNSDGSVFFDVVPAAPVSGDVTITIDGTGSTTLPSPRTNINNFTFGTLAVGTYSYTILYGDASCTKVGTFSIDRSGTIGTATVSDLIDPVCFGDTGTATIDVPGETGNILQWSANGTDFFNFVAGNAVPGLPGGLIAVQRAGDPCAAGVVLNFNIPDDFPLVITPGDATCTGTDGTITVSNVNGADYVFEIDGVQTILPADSTFRDLVANDYTLMVKDSKGCSREYTSIIVGQVVGSASLDTLYVHKGISVPDLPSGSALVGVSPSNLEPYETRLELTQAIFPSQEFLSDWSEVPFNPQNLKFEQSYTNLYAGVYALGLRDAGGCTKFYMIMIDVNTELFIPNIFTPNEDGHNDVFYIRNLPADSKLLVTNRWGKEVYKTSAYQNDWNGGDTVDGMYYYSVTLGSQSYTGWVEILRGQ